MDYKEFCQRIGKLSMPEEIPSGLLAKPDSIHLVLDLGEKRDDGCVISLSSRGMKMFVEAIEVLEARKAVRERDYVVCCAADREKYMVSLHTTTKFLSDEDFDTSIKRMSTHE